MSVIVVSDLTKCYGRRTGVEALSFSVPQGELFAFLGPNGSGKTTTIRLLLGLLRPTAGGARILGRDCWSASHHVKADVGYVPGDLRLYPWMTGRLALRICGRVRGQDLTAKGNALAEGLLLDLTVPVRRMSKGMRQKLGLILALAPEPRLLILDEPTTALDPLMQDQVYQYLRDQARQGRTVFFSSHTLSEVEQLCDHVAILREGRVVADESLETLRRRARRTVVIRWPGDVDGDALKPPPFLQVHEKNHDRWRGSLTGPTAELLRWLGGRPVADLSISPPNLESLFREYYRREAADQ